MFIGHYALGYASKKIEGAPSLAISFIAVQLLDLIWPVLVLMGIETVAIQEGITKMTPLDFTFYPYSHSLLMSVVWGLVFGLIYYLVTKSKKGSLIVGLLVISHWFLDLLTHRPDLPLSPFGETKVGFGLWNYPAVEIIIEVGLFLLGVFYYMKYSKSHRKIASWLLIAFLFIIHLMNMLGPPPPSVDAVAWAASLMWIFVLWAWFADRKKAVASS